MGLNPNVCLFRILCYKLGAVCRSVDLNSVSFHKNRLACILHTEASETYKQSIS